MREGSSPPVYSAPARWLHWLTAACVLSLIPAGFVMARLGEGPVTNALYELHKSVGMTAFAIVVVRIAVRLTRGAPPPDQGLTPFERALSTWVHRALYALVFVMPILGYLGTSMCCAPVNLFWLAPVPLDISGSEATAKAIFTAHKALGFTLAALVALHLAGVFRHAVIKRDGVLRRMLPVR